MTPPAGAHLTPEAWLSEYDACKELVQEILQIIQVSNRPGAAGTAAVLNNRHRDMLLCLQPQERNLQYPDGGPDASRMTATARRKLSILGTQLEQLFKWLDSSEAAAL
jgi:SYP5 family syntaxin